MTKEKSIDIAIQAGIVERGMGAYEDAKERGWVGLSDERLMEMPKQEQDDSVSYIKEVIEALYENSDPVSVEAAELLERIVANQEQGELETLNYTVSVMCKRCGSHEKYDLKVDYPPPQQRTWIGLLDDEKEHIEISGGKADLTLAEKIETILKERNT